jgi:outer membrane lipopolysaccharide assembly protein LptE/RlpB
MNKKIILSLVFTLLIGCGFTPMLKDFDLSKIDIQEINYSGKNELVYLLKTHINLKEKESSKGIIANLNISETIASSTKNASGIVIKEDLTLTIGIKILDSEKSVLLDDSISNTKQIAVTSNLSADEETKRNERRDLLQNMSQKIKFKLQLISKQQQ